MIADDKFRAKQKAVIEGINLDATFFNRESPREQDYVAAFQYLFTQHDVLANDGAATPLRVPKLRAEQAYAQPC